MKTLHLAGALMLALTAVACGGNGAPAQQDQDLPVADAGTPANPAEPTYSATGRVTAIAAGEVTISHGPVEGIGWPAMTMTFTAASPEMAQGISVGDAVDFAFREAGGGAYALTSLSKAR